MADSAKTVIAVLGDLFFTVKIQDAAKRAGAAVAFVKTAEQALAALPGSAVMVVDLNWAGIDPIDLVKRVKSAGHSVPVIGFVSHAQVDLRRQAEGAGYDMVVARSAFSSNLAGILERHLD